MEFEKLPVTKLLSFFDLLEIFVESFRKNPKRSDSDLLSVKLGLNKVK